MREIAITVGLVLAIAALGAISLVHWRDLFAVGIVLNIVGFAIGVPAGFLYHLFLYRSLRGIVQLPKRWFWNPIRLNSHLKPGDRRHVMSCCYIGAGGFFIIVAGQLLILVSMAIGYARI